MKTNAARILQGLGIGYTLQEYEVDPEDLSAVNVARKIGMPVEQVFKTLLTTTGLDQYVFAVIPGDAELDFKKLARAAGARKAEMVTLKDVQTRLGVSVILIGHDMGLMAQFVDKVAVMYAGRLVEVATVREMFTDPKHPYSQALISSLPNLDNKGVFQGIPGLAPSLLRLPGGMVGSG